MESMQSWELDLFIQHRYARTWTQEMSLIWTMFWARHPETGNREYDRVSRLEGSLPNEVT